MPAWEEDDFEEITEDAGPSRLATARLRWLRWQSRNRETVQDWRDSFSDWWHQIDWGDFWIKVMMGFLVMVLLVLLFGVVSVLTSGISNAEKRCTAIAAKMEVESYYDSTVGCMIQASGRWYPLENLQFFVPPGE